MKLVDLSKAIMRVEINLNMMLPTLLVVRYGAWIVTVSIIIIRREEKG